MELEVLQCEDFEIWEDDEPAAPAAQDATNSSSSVLAPEAAAATAGTRERVALGDVSRVFYERDYRGLLDTYEYIKSPSWSSQPSLGRSPSTSNQAAQSRPSGPQEFLMAGPALRHAHSTSFSGAPAPTTSAITSPTSSRRVPSLHRSNSVSGPQPRPPQQNPLQQNGAHTLQPPTSSTYSGDASRGLVLPQQRLNTGHAAYSGDVSRGLALPQQRRNTSHSDDGRGVTLPQQSHSVSNGLSSDTNRGLAIPQQGLSNGHGGDVNRILQLPQRGINTSYNGDASRSFAMPPRAPSSNMNGSSSRGPAMPLQMPGPTGHHRSSSAPLQPLGTRGGFGMDSLSPPQATPHQQTQAGLRGHSHLDSAGRDAMLSRQASGLDLGSLAGAQLAPARLPAKRGLFDSGGDSGSSGARPLPR